MTARRGRLTKLFIRVSVGALLLVALFGAFYSESVLAESYPSLEVLPSAVILALLAAGGAVETARLLAAMGLPSQARWCALGGAVHILALFPWPGLDASVQLAPALLALWVLAPLALAVVAEEEFTAAKRLAGNACALIYVPFMLGFLFRIRCLPEDGLYLMMGVVVTTKCSDIGAYLAGWAFGRHKAIPRLSPAKTWEGYIGGALGSLLVAFLFFIVHPGIDHQVVSLPGAILLGIVLAVGAPIGDLMESLFKRAAATKDSADLIPEFGGVLDIVDSLVVVAPAAYLILRLS